MIEFFMGIPPTDFLLYYAGGMLALIGVLFWRLPHRGMRLRLGSGKKGTDYKSLLKGRQPPATSMPRINPNAERSINVVFNFNGHSWDAYEVLGLPAGSGLPVVQAAYREALERVDESSRPFLLAAYNAIEANLAARKASGS